MGATLDDASLIDDEYLIRATDSRQAMGDDEARSPLKRRIQRTLDKPLAFAVEVGGGLVQDYYPRRLQEQSSQGQTLLLTPRESVPPIAHHGVETVGKLVDQVHDLRVLARLHHLVRRSVRLRVPQVGADRVVEQVRLLAHDSDGRTQVVSGHVPDIHTTEANRSVAWVIQAGD